MSSGCRFRGRRLAEAERLLREVEALEARGGGASVDAAAAAAATATATAVDAVLNAVATAITARRRCKPSDSRRHPPLLLLGDGDHAQDTRQLRALGVAHVQLCVAHVRGAGDIRGRGDATLSSRPWTTRRTRSSRPSSTRRARSSDARASARRVLVCHAGANRSAAFCVSTQLREEGRALERAVRHAHAAPIILTNEGFVDQLIELVEAVEARRRPPPNTNGRVTCVRVARLSRALPRSCYGLATYGSYELVRGVRARTNLLVQALYKRVRAFRRRRAS